MAIESYIADMDQPLQNFQAVREFTDREEYRASFWRKYEEIQKDMTLPLEQRRIHVLTYYGYGGIGKSSLAKKLRSEMDEHPSKPIHALYDFKKSQDSIQALSELHATLTQKGKFTFPLFEYGLYFYAKKSGGNADSPEVQTVLDQSTVLKMLFKIAKCIPIASEIAGITEEVISLADEGVKALRNFVIASNRKNIKFDEMDSEALYQYLPQLFILDMQNNLRKSKRPVVILLDTYEALVNEVAHGKSYLEYDKWLRSTEAGKAGVIVGTPGVLWVITGREKLKWPEAWDGTLEQHILGSLSEQDAKLFLNKCGIQDEALQDGLWKLTDGFPLYLDLCVTCYEGILAQNMTPELSLFGKDKTELVARFMNYTSDAQQDNIYMLACLHHWTENLIAELGLKILPNFSASTYETVMGLSVVDTSDPKYCHIHQVVEQILTDDCPSLIRNAVGSALLDKFLPVLQNKIGDKREYTEALFYAMRGAILRYKNRDELCSFYTENLANPLNKFYNPFRYRRHLAIPAVELLDAVARADSTDSLYAVWLDLRYKIARADNNHDDVFKFAFKRMEQAFTKDDPLSAKTIDVMEDFKNALRSLELHEEEYSCTEAILSLCELTLGKCHPKTLSAASSLAFMLRDRGQIQEAIDLMKTKLEEHRKTLGDNHRHTIEAIRELAFFCEQAGLHQEALTLYKTAFEKSSITLGHDHSNTKRLLWQVAGQLNKMGLHQEELDFYKDIIETRRATLGEDHPKTLDARNRAADKLYEMGLHQESLDMRKTVLDMQRTRHGDFHQDTIRTMTEYIRTLYTLGQRQEALNLVKVVLEKCAATLGEDHDDSIRAMEHLASELSKLALHQEALDVRKTVLDMQRTRHGDFHQGTIRAMTEYIRTLYTLGQRQEALNLVKVVLEKCAATLGEDHEDTFEATAAMADQLLDIGEYQTGLDLLKRVVEKSFVLYGEDSEKTLICRLGLAIWEDQAAKHAEKDPAHPK